MHNNIFNIIIFALLSAFGAMARQLNSITKEPLKPAAFISGCIIASFMGLIFYFITDYIKITGSIAYAVAGICGWIGPHIMDKVSEMVMSAAGIKLTGDKAEVNTEHKASDGGEKDKEESK